MTAEPAIVSTDDAATASAGDRIFQAARELFYQQGIRAVGVEAIAAAAGTTKMSLYRNFSSKDDLVAAVLKDADRRFWDWWDEIVEPLEGQPRKQIERLFREFETLASDAETCRGCPIANAAVEIVDDAHPARRIVAEHHDEMLRRLRSLARDMGARDPGRLGDSLMLLMGGSFLSRLVFDNTGPIGSVFEAARILLDSPALGAAAA